MDERRKKVSRSVLFAVTMIGATACLYYAKLTIEQEATIASLNDQLSTQGLEIEALTARLEEAEARARAAKDTLVKHSVDTNSERNQLRSDEQLKQRMNIRPVRSD